MCVQCEGRRIVKYGEVAMIQDKIQIGLFLNMNSTSAIKQTSQRFDDFNTQSCRFETSREPGIKRHVS